MHAEMSSSDVTASHNCPNILFLDHVGVLGGAEIGLIDMVTHARGRAKTILMAHGPLEDALVSFGTNVSVEPLSVQIASIQRGSGLWHAIQVVPHVMRLAFRISRVAKNFDVIWANSQKAFVIGCFASLLSRRPLVWHLHDILTAEHFSAANRRIAVILANCFASRVVTVSKAGLQSFIDSGGREALGCVVYNGIAPGSFGAPPGNLTSHRKLREEFAIGNAPVVGIFGRLTPWKGQSIMIHALNSLPGVHTLLVGEATFGEDDYVEYLRGLALELGVADRVHFAGFLPDVAGAMREVDIVAHTSTSPEPFGRVLVEAMLEKRPLIASDAGGVTEIVSHEVNGWLVIPGDVLALASTVRKILANPAKAKSMANTGYLTAINDFSLDQFLAGIDAVVANVTTSSQSQVVSDVRLRDKVSTNARFGTKIS